MNVAPEARRCGYVFQEYALFGHLSAWRNVAYGLRGVARAERRARARRAARALRRRRRSPTPGRRTLSGGERQRVALARALAAQPARAAARRAALRARHRAPAPRRARELRAVLARRRGPGAAGHARLRRGGAARRPRRRDRRAGAWSRRAPRPSWRPRRRRRSWPTSPAPSCSRARARADAAGSRAVALDGGGEVASLQRGDGPVTVERLSVGDRDPARPAEHHGSAQNRLAGARASRSPTSATACASAWRRRQPLAAEVSEAAVRELGLEPGVRVVASWKAAATRLLAA